MPDETIRGHLEAILAEHRAVNIHPLPDKGGRTIVCARCGGRGGQRHPCATSSAAAAALALFDGCDYEWVKGSVVPPGRVPGRFRLVPDTGGAS